MTRPLNILFTKENKFVEFDLSDPFIPESIAAGFDKITSVNCNVSEGWQCDEISYLASKPCFFEWQRFNCSIGFPKDQISGNLQLYINSIPHEVKSRIHGDLVLINTNFKFDNAVGYTTIEVKDSENSGLSLFKFETEIFPQKLDYKDDYDQMMEDVTSIIYNLAFDYLKQTHSLGVPKDSYNKSLNEFIAILKVIYERLESSIDQILRNPKSKIHQIGRVQEVSQVKRIVKRPDKWVLKSRKYISSKANSNSIQIDTNAHITHLPEQKKYISYDTFENQFVLWAINDVISKIDDVIQSIKISKYRNAKGIKSALDELNTFKRRLRFRTSDQYFREVSKFDLNFHFSTTLTMAPGYKDFYKRYLLLKKGLSISENDIFKIDLKDIATLYEYWCFLKIIDTLKNNKKYDFESSDLLQVEHQKFVVKLKKGQNSNIHMRKKETGERISIGYNREFPYNNGNGVSSTFTQIPDNFIEFSKEGYDSIGPIIQPFKYVLDAKYRFDKPNTASENLADNLDDNKKGAYDPPQDAIGQLHRYRDAMLWKTEKSDTYQKAIKNLGGVILFPYPLDEHNFLNSKYFQSLKEVNIGAVPLKPGGDNIIFQQFLDNLFETSGDELIEDVIDYDKTPLRMFERNIRIPVLIGMIRSNSNEERLEFFRKNNLFYVHKSTNPRLFDIRRLMIYNQKTNRIIGQYRVEKLFFEKSHKYPEMVNPSKEEYLFFKVRMEKKMDLEFNLEGFGSSYFFTNQYAIDIFEDSGDKSVLKLNIEDQFRHVRRLRANKQKFEVKRIGNFRIDESNRDVSKICFTQFAVSGFILKNDKVLLERSFSEALETKSWQIPSFAIGDKEVPNSCFVNNISKKIGINIRIKKDLKSVIHQGEKKFIRQKTFLFTCEMTDSDQKINSTNRYKWFTIKQLEDKMNDTKILSVLKKHIY